MPRQYITEQQKYLHLASCLDRAANRKRPKEIAITVEYLVELWKKQRGRCPASMLPLEVRKGGHWNGEQNPFVASIDRINNRLGYIKGNVRIVCWFWNNLKAKKEDIDVALGLADVVYALQQNGILDILLQAGKANASKR